MSYEISKFRILAEVEKIFTVRNPDHVKTALEAFKAFLPPLVGLDTLDYFVRLGQGDPAFLWAGLLQSELEITNLGLSSKDTQQAINYLRGEHNFYALSENEFLAALNFNTAQQMRERYLAFQALAPYSSPEEKVRGLGYDGNYLMAQGLKGKELGLVIQTLNKFVARKPDATGADLEDLLKGYSVLSAVYSYDSDTFDKY